MAPGATSSRRCEVARKKTTPTAEPGTTVCAVTYSEFDSSKLIQIGNGIGTEPNNLGDAFADTLVKFTPDIAAEHRAQFDAAKWRRCFLDAGARGVVIAPRVIGTAKRERAPELVRRAATSPHDAFDAWVQALVGVETKDKDAARVLFDSLVGKTGTK